MSIKDKYKSRKIEKMRNQDINKYFYKSVSWCLKDKIKLRFESQDEQYNYYIDKLKRSISHYDIVLLSAAYKYYVIKKYNHTYYHTHRELEIFIYLAFKYSKRMSFKNVNKVEQAMPKRKELKKLDLLLRKINALFALDKEIEHSNYYLLYKDPEYVLRFKTHFIRGEGSGRQYIDYFTDIMKIFDNKTKKDTRSKLALIPNGFIELMNQPNKKRINKDTQILSFDNYKKIYCDFFGIKKINRLRYMLSIASNFSSFISLSYLYYESFYQESDLKKILGLEDEETLYKMSLNSTSNFEDSYIWYDNPVRIRPFVRVNGYYLYPILTLPLTYIDDMIKNILSKNDKLLFQRIKTNEIMENKIYSLFFDKFSDIKIYKNLNYLIAGKKYETDILIVHKDSALIVEAKGHNLTESAKRGAPERVKKKIEEIITSASEQSSRLQDLILAGKNVDFSSNDGKVTLNFDKVRYVNTLSVSFEWLIFFSTSMHSIRDSHQIAKRHVHCSLTELDIIVDTCDSIEQLLYYFSKRSLIEESQLKIKADELDLFTYFIDNGFRFHNNKYDFIDVTGNFDNHGVSKYISVKHNLSIEKNDKTLDIYRQKYQKTGFTFIPLFEDIIENIRKDKTRVNLLFEGFLKTFPYNMQRFMYKKITKEFKNKNTDLNMLMCLVDDYSPALYFLIDKADRNFAIKQLNEIIKKYTNDKANKHGAIVVVIKGFSRKQSLKVQEVIYL